MKNLLFTITLCMGLSELHVMKIQGMNNGRRLISAAKMGRTKVVRRLLETGAFVDQVGHNGSTPLFLASMNGHLKTARVLIQHGANIEKTTSRSETPLMIAAAYNEWEIVQLLIDNGAAVGRTQFRGATALYIASEQGSLEAAQLLVQAGASVEKVLPTAGSPRPLHVAVSRGHLFVVQCLIEHNADINAVFGHKTPFQMAIDGKEIKIAQYLIQKGATVTPHNLETARVKGCFLDITAGCIDFLRAHSEELPKYFTAMRSLIMPHQPKRGWLGRVDARKTMRWINSERGKLCAAVCAALFPLSENMQEFRQAGIEFIRDLVETNRLFSTQLPTDISDPLCNGHTDFNTNIISLYHALIRGRTSKVKQLIAYADGIQNLFHVTPLHLSVQGGYGEIVTFLLAEGHDVNAVATNDNQGCTPLYIAAKNGRLDIVQNLIDHGADVNACMTNGASPLIIALYKKHLNITELLLHAGADPKTVTNTGLTPLFLAAQHGYIHLVHRFLDAGATVNRVTVQGTTPLLIAVYNGHEEVVQKLIKSGADITTQWSRGKNQFTAFIRHGLVFYAIEQGHISIAHRLILAGAPVTIHDLEFARKEGRLEEIISGITDFLHAHPDKLLPYRVVMKRHIASHAWQLEKWLQTEKGKLCTTVCHKLFPDICIRL